MYFRSRIFHAAVCVTLAASLYAFCARQGAVIISDQSFEERQFKPSRDTVFRADLWAPYLHAGETDPKDCGIGAFPKGIVSSAISTDLARTGTHSGKCIMDINNGGICHKAMFRNDFLPKGAVWTDPDSERWIAFSIYLPAMGPDAWLKDSVPELVFQLHNDTVASPQLALYSQNGLFSVRYRYSAEDPHTSRRTAQTAKTSWEGKIPTGHWIDWIWHIRFSPIEKKGVLQVWMADGSLFQQIVNEHNMRIGYPCSQVTNCDIGLYKWAWKCPVASSVKRRVIYIDAIRIEDRSATLTDMEAQ